MPPVTSLGLKWSCENFEQCQTPDVVSDGKPDGWTDNYIDGTRVVLCQVDSPNLAKVAPAIAQAVAASVQFP